MTPVEQLLAAISRSRPDVRIERLTVTHPADDDNVWFIRDGRREVQLDCHPGGSGPFLVEGDEEAPVQVADVEEALAAVQRVMRW